MILLQALTYGTSGSEGLGGAWVALSALRLQCLDGQPALDAAAAGLAWLRARQEVLPGKVPLLEFYFEQSVSCGGGSSSPPSGTAPYCLACAQPYT